jgi:hypothetical protein
MIAFVYSQLVELIVQSMQTRVIYNYSNSPVRITIALKIGGKLMLQSLLQGH